MLLQLYVLNDDSDLKNNRDDTNVHVGRGYILALSLEVEQEVRCTFIASTIVLVSFWQLYCMTQNVAQCHIFTAINN